MAHKIKLLLAEDKALMRKSLIALLKDYTLFEVVGEASNGRELLDSLKYVQVDVVLLDLEMPVMNGVEVLKIMKRRYPDVKVMILSVHNQLGYVKEAIALGAKGYIAKDCFPSQLENAILQIHESGFYLEEAMSKELLHDSVYGMTQPSVSKILSNREVEVLKEICSGKTEKEIASYLNISVHTVHFHKMNIYFKTNVHNVAGLLRFAKSNEQLLGEGFRTF